MNKLNLKEKPIGIFDSGVGGLTVVKEIIKTLPNENIVYFGDTARVPYGSKSKDTVTEFSKQIINFLIQKDVKAVVIACNTVSANSYEEMVRSFDIPILEVIKPGVYSCLSNENISRIGVIGTEGTIKSKAHETFLKHLKPNIEVYSKACPLFVPLAEEGWTDNKVAKITSEIYLKELIDKNIETLILGCTHYPLLENCIRQFVGNIQIINPAEAVAKDMKKYLINNNMINDSNENPIYKFYVSDNTEKFSKICKLVLNKEYQTKIARVDK